MHCVPRPSGLYISVISDGQMLLTTVLPVPERMSPELEMRDWVQFNGTEDDGTSACTTRAPIRSTLGAFFFGCNTMFAILGFNP